MTTEETRFNASARRLCPDGNCLGLVSPGEDGRCNVCGKKASGERAASAGAASATTQGGDNDGGDVDGGGGEEALGAEAETGASETAQANVPVLPAGDFDPSRRLCDDGSCVGVIGPGGACTVCGRVAS